MDNIGHYALIVATLDNKVQARQILVDQLGYHHIDLERTVRHLPGILARNLTEVQASALHDGLEQAGCRCVVTLMDSLPDVEHVAASHHVRCLESGLEVLDLAGEKVEVIPWSSFYFISIGNIPHSMNAQPKSEISLESFQVTGVHDALIKSVPKANQLWLAARLPDRCFRFDEHEMNYEYLGDRMTSSGTRNFQLFAEDLIRYAPHLVRSKSAADFFRSHSILKSNFASADDYRHQVQAEIVLARDEVLRDHEC